MNHSFFKGMLCLLLFLAAAGCKKEKNAAPAGLAGTYVFYELEDYATGKVEPLPTPDGSTGQIVITLTNGGNEADATLQTFERGVKVAERTYHLKVSKDADGDHSLLDRETNKLAVFFIDNEVDIYVVEGFRIGARK